MNESYISGSGVKMRPMTSGQLTKVFSENKITWVGGKKAIDVKAGTYVFQYQFGTKSAIRYGANDDKKNVP